MPKDKIEIVDLNLGFDPKDLTTKPVLSDQTQQKITDLIAHEKVEQTAIQSYKKRKEEEAAKKETDLENCLKVLIERSQEKKTMPIDEVLRLTGSDDPSGIMQKLRNLIKRRGGLWEVKKSKAGGVTQYFLTPSETEKPEEKDPTQSIIDQIRKTTPTPPSTSA